MLGVCFYSSTNVDRFVQCVNMLLIYFVWICASPHNQMTVGEKIVLHSPPQYAYGVDGCPPVVASNAHLKFELELLRFQRPNETEKQNANAGADKRSGQKVISHLGDDLFVDANP